jgi:hypothetical protein
MRILNQDNNKPAKSILIMLTPSEAKELVSKIQRLTSEKGDHLHLYDETYSREITVAIYTPENLNSFNCQVIQLIEQDN